MNEIEKLVFEAIGEASMAWEPRPTGEFQSTLAADIGKRLMVALKEKSILLSDAEIQSNLNRVSFAENLIIQMPKDHDGRNTWLLNYGILGEAIRLQIGKGLKWVEATRCCEGNTGTPAAATTGTAPVPGAGGIL